MSMTWSWRHELRLWCDRCSLFIAHLPDEHDIVMETTESDFEYQPMYADLRLFQDEARQLHLVWEVNVDFEDAWYATDASQDV